MCVRAEGGYNNRNHVSNVYIHTYICLDFLLEHKPHIPLGNHCLNSTTLILIHCHLSVCRWHLATCSVAELFMRELTNQDYNTNNPFGNSSVSEANSGFI